MVTSDAPSGAGAASSRHLRRSVGFWGLTFVSLGSIIGSGWLLGALGAAKTAGPASLLSWILAGFMLALLALTHAELGAAYPVAGGTARFPSFAFGNMAGFTAGWTAWLQAVTLAPIEVEASLQYLNNITWVKHNIAMLHVHADGSSVLSGSGLLIASLLMLAFTVVNILGVKLLSDANGAMVIWKTAIPVLTVIVLLALTFHGGNFHAGGSFAPFGAHGVFAALPAGVVFALQGFEQAIQLGGEAKNPQRDISRAVIVAMLIGTAIYILLEVAFIGGLDPANLVHGWANPVAKGDFGPYATIATTAGAGWLAWLLYVDAFISPAGTGLVYMGTSSRLSYALGRTRTLPKQLAIVDRRGTPLWSILLAFVIGELCFLPFPSWQSLVGLVTSATAIMYAFAPVSLIALRATDPDRTRPYRLPAARVTAPLAFISANLIIYWSGFEVAWKILVAIVIGFILYGVTLLLEKDNERPTLDLRSAAWVPPWLIGITVIGWLGRYGTGASKDIPEWWDLAVVIVFSLAIFYWAVNVTLPTDRVNANVEAERLELDVEEDMAV